MELEPHPEGGYFKQTYAAEDHFTVPKQYEGSTRPAATHIYYLLDGEDYSSWHRIKSDEIWHFYAGSTLSLHILNTDGFLETIKLGNGITEHNAVFHYCVPKELWFAASVDDKDSYSLLGCTVSPGFDYRDWELADNETLLKQFPQHRDIINQHRVRGS
tara:strand:+ start:40496 stop:40972 length:477 start_codon:yes stop_codon:yes gene_type:complete